MFVRKVLFFIIAPYRMCGSTAHYCSCVNFTQVAPAWFSVAEQSRQNCKYCNYINYTTCTLKMYFRISETYLLFIGCVIIMIIEMRVQLKNLKHDQITLLLSNPFLFCVCMYIFYVSPLHFLHVISLLKHKFLSI